MKYVFAIALAIGLGASAQAATPITHTAVASMKPGVMSGVIKAADKGSKDTKGKKKKKKKKTTSNA